MSILNENYLTQVVKEEGLEGELKKIGTLDDLLETLSSMQRNIGVAEFTRQWDSNRRAMVYNALDTLSSAKSLSNGADSVRDTLANMRNIQMGIGVVIAISIIAGIIGAYSYWQIGLGVFTFGCVFAWYFWPTIKLFIQSQQRGSSFGSLNINGLLPRG